MLQVRCAWGVCFAFARPALGLGFSGRTCVLFEFALLFFLVLLFLREFLLTLLKTEVRFSQ